MNLYFNTANMTRFSIPATILFILLMILGYSCQNDSGSKIDQLKVDSLSQNDEERAKKYEDSINRVINAMSDSDIVNDSNGMGR